MTTKTITVQELYDGQVCEVTLGTPPANILTAGMMAEIEALLDKEHKKTGRKLIVFQGAGKNFCFGASVEEHQRDQVADMLPAFHRLIGKILDHPVPTLAKVSGQCLGGGFELALAATFVIADEGANFATPEIKLGVFPPVAALLLPWMVGCGRANWLVLTGKSMGAEALHQAGVITALAPEGQLDTALRDFIEKQICPKSASSLQTAHKAARCTLVRHFNNHIGDLEDLYLKDLMASHDANEGIEAFLEKRKPEWKHV
jgi:cyclohexa-1,5-dienecarbonyl-CoA hydratase